MNKLYGRPKLILASKSPRRSDLLKQAGLTFSIIPSEFDESSVTMSDPESYVRTLAKSKATDISKKYPDSWVLGADTIVRIDGRLRDGNAVELEKVCESFEGRLTLDLSGLRFADAAGIRLLNLLVSRGALLQGVSAYIQLLLAQMVD